MPRVDPSRPLDGSESSPSIIVVGELTQLLLHEYKQGPDSCALAEAERALLLERERAWRAKVSHLWSQNCA